MGFKKFLPSWTQTIQVSLIVIVIGAIGGLTMGQGWIKTHILGRV